MRSLDPERRKTVLPIPGMGTLSWRPCEKDLSVWRMVCLQPDREVFAKFDLARAELLSFDVEWDDQQGRRRFVTWSATQGFSAGMTDSERTIDGPGAGRAAANLEALSLAHETVEDAGIDSPVATWITDRLSAAPRTRGDGDEDGPDAVAGPGPDGRGHG